MLPYKFHVLFSDKVYTKVNITNIKFMQINNCHCNCNKYIICNGGERRVGYATYRDNNNIILITHSVVKINNTYIDPTPCGLGYNYRYFIDLADSIEGLQNVIDTDFSDLEL